MALEVTPSGQACGASVRGVDLSKPLSKEMLAELKEIWLEHHVLAFPDQDLTDDQLEAFGAQWGELGEDPFFNPLPGRKYTAAIKREADDTNAIFAEHWHSDWSFMETPPQATVLYSLDIPPVGGDTHFCNQHLAFEGMSQDMHEKFDGLTAIHSPELGYSPDGVYGTKEGMGSMDVKPSEDAKTMVYKHPIAPPHPDTGRRGLLSGISYICGFEGMTKEEAYPLIFELNDLQNREEFLYKHKWEERMLVIWDNRSVAHKATGGFEGHRRELHRVTVY